MNPTTNTTETGKSEVKFNYKNMSSYPFAQTVQKLGNTILPIPVANLIKDVWVALKNRREAIVQEYQRDIIDVFGKRDETTGAILRPEGETEGFIPIEGKEAELEAVNKAFGERVATIYVTPINANMLHSEGVKLSAAELELLGGILTFDEYKPALPNTGGKLSRIG